jgi:HTH-like domain
MIDRDHKLSLARQAKALGISRGSVYYPPRPVSAADLTLMRRIDEKHLEYPFAGSRMLKGLLNDEGHKVGRCHVATLMKRMGVSQRGATGSSPLANGDLPPPEDLEAGAGTQDLSLSPAEAGRDPPKPGPGHGHHLCPHGARSPLSLGPMARQGSPSTSRPSSIGSAARS